MGGSNVSDSELVARENHEPRIQWTTMPNTVWTDVREGSRYNRGMNKYPCLASWTLAVLLTAAVSLPPAVAEDLGKIPSNVQIAILRNPGTTVLGEKSADVTLVEYFDYNCPFCKKLNPALQGLLAADAHVALVYKDWPILSDVSNYAARLALAAGWQDQYRVAHDTLMNATHLGSSVQVDALLAGAGLDIARLKQVRDAHAEEIDALLVRNDAEARSLGIKGTPGLLVGRHIINGVYTVAGLQQAVAIARHETASK
jgi:protein-disulfide isomerase